jgi:hypothetical protein
VDELSESDALSRLIEQYLPGAKSPDEATRLAAGDILVGRGDRRCRIEAVARLFMYVTRLSVVGGGCVLPGSPARLEQSSLVSRWAAINPGNADEVHQDVS